MDYESTDLSPWGELLVAGLLILLALLVLTISVGHWWGAW
jgi:hypothetical protein